MKISIIIYLIYETLLIDYNQKDLRHALVIKELTFCIVYNGIDRLLRIDVVSNTRLCTIFKLTIFIVCRNMFLLLFQLHAVSRRISNLVLRHSASNFPPEIKKNVNFFPFRTNLEKVWSHRKF